jgi:hypothetical protein
MPEQEYRTPRVLIKEAELLSGTNDFVRDYYCGRATTGNIGLGEDVDEDTEVHLISKNDPFINITLARYCKFGETLCHLFQASLATDNLALRLACLSNETSTRYYPSFPLLLFGTNDLENLETKIESWFARITSAELFVLFENSAIADDFLTCFLLRGDNLWDLLSENNQLNVIYALTQNKRVGEIYTKDWDGFSRYEHNKVFESIWNLAKILPVTEKWAWALGGLLHKTVDHRGSFDSLEVADRWKVAQEKTARTEGLLDAFEHVRSAIFRDVIKDSYGEHGSSRSQFEHKDIAHRAAAYQSVKLLSVDFIHEAYTKDKYAAVLPLIMNINVWCRRDLRVALLDICLDPNRDDSHDYVDTYFLKERSVFEQHPEWFSEESEGGDLEDTQVASLLVNVQRILEENCKLQHENTKKLEEIIGSSMTKDDISLYFSELRNEIVRDRTTSSNNYKTLLIYLGELQQNNMSRKSGMNVFMSRVQAALPIVFLGSIFLLELFGLFLFGVFLWKTFS